MISRLNSLAAEYSTDDIVITISAQQVHFDHTEERPELLIHFLRQALLIYGVCHRVACVIALHKLAVLSSRKKYSQSDKRKFFLAQTHLKIIAQHIRINPFLP